MISNEYPELERKISFVPRDIKVAMDPAVIAYLDEAAKRIQPIVDRALVLWYEDLTLYGSTRTIEEYIAEALR